MQKQARQDYMIGLLFPDYAVQNGLEVKCYSDFPIPTVSMGFHTYQTYTTSTLGTFLLSWRPKLFITGSDNANMSNVTYNNSATLSGTATNVANNFVTATNYVHNTAIQRYRLVSAMCQVNYTGSVLNQSGNVAACATFDPFRVANATAAASDGNVDRFAIFSLVENGLWNQRVNITDSARGLSVFYLPMDPDDLFFERQGYWYSNDMGIGSGAVINPDPEGAHINYVICGAGLPSSSSCVRVDWYYNYEVIVDPSAQALFKPRTCIVGPELHDKLLSTVKDNVAKIAVRSNDSSNNDSIWDKFKRYAPEVATTAISILKAFV